MIINIDDEVFAKVLQIVIKKDAKLYNILKEITPLQDLNTLETARTIKTDRIKERIKSTLIELLQADINPTKYKVHKRTNIAFITLKKYYDYILDEVQNER